MKTVAAVVTRMMTELTIPARRPQHRVSAVLTPVPLLSWSLVVCLTMTQFIPSMASLVMVMGS